MSARIYYLIRPKVEPIGTGERIPFESIIAEIDDRADRNIGRYIVGAIDASRRRGKPARAFVAMRGSRSRGFIVERVDV